MASSEQKKRLLKAKITVALQDETGHVPSKEKIEEVFLLTRVMYKAVLLENCVTPLPRNLCFRKSAAAVCRQ